MLTSTEIVSFILRYRKGKCFTNWTPKEIHDLIVTSIDEKSILVDFVPSTEEIVSIVVGTIDTERCVVHVSQALSKYQNNRGNLAILANWVNVNYPGFNITAMRRGRLVKYDETKLFRKLGVI